MKRLLSATLLLVASSLAAQTVTMVANEAGVVDGGNIAIQSGKIIFAPTDVNGNPLNVNLGSTGGFMVPRRQVCNIVSGAITTTPTGSSCTLLDTAVTNAQHFCYLTTIIDSQTGWTAPPISCLQPASSGQTSWCTTSGTTTCDLGKYVPSAGPTALQLTGPPGPAGSGFNPRGTYSSGATYATNDFVTYSGVDYVCITACSGVTPTAGANWQVLVLEGGGVNAGTTGQLCYYATSSSTCSGLNLGTGLAITAGTLNASASGSISGQTTGCLLNATSATGSTASSSVCDNGSQVSTSETLNAAKVTTGTPSTAAGNAIPSGAHGIAMDSSSTSCIPQTGVDAFCFKLTEIDYSANGNAFQAIGTGGGSSLATASTPSFSPSAGTIGSGSTVALSCTYGAAYYCIGSSLPCSGAVTTYSSAISVTAAETINAMCGGVGYASTSASAAYTVSSGFTITQQQTGTSTGSSAATTFASTAFTSALTANSTIVLPVYGFTSSPVPTFTASDSCGNSYIDSGAGSVHAYNSGGIFGYVAVLIGTNTHGACASDVVTVSSSTGIQYSGIFPFELTGAPSSSQVEAYASVATGTGGTSGANAVSGASVTPTINGSFVFALALASAGGPSAGTSPNAYTALTNLSSAEYLTQATAAAIAPTFGETSSSVTFGEITVAVKP